jgi:predicted phosphodiesterase
MPKGEICPGCRKVNPGNGKFCSSCRSRASRRGIRATGDGDFEITVEEPAAAIAASKPDQFSALVKATRKGAVPFEDLCNTLDLSPAKLRDLLDRASEANLVIGVAGGKVGFLNAPKEEVQEVGVSPVVGQRQMVAHITDTHLGSKWCLRHYLKDFVRYAYSKGVREILHTGDVLDGNYKGHGFERSHEGLTEQIRDLFDVLPRAPGLTYHAISGNHDQTFEDESGVDVGAAIAGYFRDHGRDDWRGYGTRGALLRVRGVLCDLWHPGGSVSYATSYKMHKKVEAYAPGSKPQILLIGHWHRFCYIYERGIHAIAGGTFQGGGSAFAKSLTCGPPAIGGSILSWDLTEQGTIRDFVLERRDYFEKEMPTELRL